MKIGVILNSTYSDSEIIDINISPDSKDEIKDFLDVKYGELGWYSYDILE